MMCCREKLDQFTTEHLIRIPQTRVRRWMRSCQTDFKSIVKLLSQISITEQRADTVIYKLLDPPCKHLYKLVHVVIFSRTLSLAAPRSTLILLAKPKNYIYF